MNTTHHTNGLVIKLGGSILHPTLGTINISLVRELSTLMCSYIEKTGKPVFLMNGGGIINTVYLNHLVDFPYVTHDEKDYIGISVTNTNALFIKTILHDRAYGEIIHSPADLPEVLEPIIYVCGAENPGHSNNYDSVIIAEYVGIDTIINISNINFIYEKNPKENPDARPWQSVTWSDYRRIIPEHWSPKAAFPFDPIASRIADTLSLTVWFLSGDDITGIKEIIETGSTKQGTLLGASETSFAE